MSTLPSSSADASGVYPAVDVSGDTLATLTPITVSLRVELDVSGEVQLFGYPADVAVNPIVCAGTLSAADMSKLFVYWQTDTERSEVSAKINPAPIAGNEEGAAALGTQFAADVILNSMDASGAAPFSAYASGNEPSYYQYASFGELALAYAAHQLFGHVQATAAIDNDVAIVNHFNVAIGMGTLLEAALKTITPSTATTIAASVIGQDAARTEGQGDNNAESDAKPLRFIENDTVFVRVTMREWSVTVANQNQTALSNNLNSYATGEKSFDLVIKLAA